MPEDSTSKKLEGALSDATGLQVFTGRGRNFQFICPNVIYAQAFYNIFDEVLQRAGYKHGFRGQATE